MEMVCIVCPNGCWLSVDKQGERVEVKGARCKRGENFAITELTCPARTVTTSVITSVAGYPVVSVKTDGEIPKDKIFPLMKLLSSYTLDRRVALGTVLFKDVLGTEVNVVTTTAMED